MSDCRSSCSGLAPDRSPLLRVKRQQKSADLSRVAAVDASLMADEEGEEEEGRNVCINVTLQLWTPLQELHAASRACPEQQASGSIPQSETELEEEEQHGAAALQISLMLQVFYGSDKFDLKMY